MKKDFQNLEKKIKINFKNKNLLIKSLTHKSFNKENNNEKLEFLGDRVLGLVMAKKLLEIYPKEKEGILDKKFASLVNRKICCEVAWSIGIHNYVIVGNNVKVSGGNLVYSFQMNRDKKVLFDDISEEAEKDEKMKKYGEFLNITCSFNSHSVQYH